MMLKPLHVRRWLSTVWRPPSATASLPRHRLSSVLLRWGDKGWLRGQPCALQGSQGYQRRFHVWRWESSLVSAFVDKRHEQVVGRRGGLLSGRSSTRGPGRAFPQLRRLGLPVARMDRPSDGASIDIELEVVSEGPRREEGR